MIKSIVNAKLLHQTDVGFTVSTRGFISMTIVAVRLRTAYI
jgi:hypothetical protein